jgi:uncharacterized protein (TIGR01777 family)
MRVAVSGSHGLIGSAVVPALEAAGHEVLRLVRSDAGAGQVFWDPSGGRIDRSGLEGVHAAVHLAGAGIGDGRWTAARKREILDSRVKGTELLARTLATLEPRPATLVSGSAIGYYGDRGDEELTEQSTPGGGFLAEVVKAWEAATAPAAEAGIRVAHVRTGIVLSGGGGVLAKQLPLFKRGLGGKLGSGRQWTSWIALDDEVAAIRHVLTDASFSGPVNLTAPHPVTNAEFTASLARVLGRGARLPVPRVALTAALGAEMARETALVSQRVRPTKLEASGFAFAHPVVDEALAAALGKECC